MHSEKLDSFISQLKDCAGGKNSVAFAFMNCETGELTLLDLGAITCAQNVVSAQDDDGSPIVLLVKEGTPEGDILNAICGNMVRQELAKD